MKHGTVHPEIPRYEWKEFVNPARATLDHVDDDGIEHFNNRFVQLADPAIEGAPATAQDSIFLAKDGLIEAYVLTTRTQKLASQERRKLLDKTVTLMKERPDFSEQLLSHLDLLADPDITDNPDTRSEATELKERLQERRHKLGQDIISPVADMELVERTRVDDIVDRFIDYRNIKPEKKRQRIEKLARELIIDPQDIEYVFDTFNLLEASDIFSESGLQTMHEYASDLTAAVNEQIGAEETPQPSDIGMEYWVTTWAKGDNLRAEKLIGAMLEKADSPAKITDLMYRMTLAASGSGDKDVIYAVLELNAGLTDYMRPESNQSADLLSARFNEDPDVYNKAWELGDALTIMLNMLMDVDKPDARQAERVVALVRASKQRVIAVNKTKRYEEEVIRIGVNHNEHYEATVQKINGPGKHSKDIADAGISKRIRVWKARLSALKDISRGNTAELLHATDNPGPLGEWTLDNTSHLGAVTAWKRNNTKVHAHLNLPGLPSAINETTRAEASQTVRALLNERSFDAPIEQRTFWNTLGYLVPKEVNMSDFARIAVANDDLRHEIKYNKVHSLSPLDDTVEVTNDTLLDLGFNSLTFAMHPDRKDLTIVTVRVGEAAFRGYFDRDYKLRELGTDRGMDLEAPAPFLEYVILSHLHQIHCTENLEVPDEAEETAPSNTVEYRRAHRRILPQGQNPSPGQIIIAWDEYGIDLVKQNRHRLAEGEPQLITWVSQVKPEHVAGRQPVRSKGDIAGARLTDLLIKS